MRYAVFFAPPPTSLLWKQGCQWLGRDAVSGATELQPLFRGLDTETIRELTRTPARYGFHATMVAPFRLKDGLQENQLLDALTDFTADKPPLTIPPLTVSQLDHFFCLRPVRHCAPLQVLASLCTRAFDRFRAPLNPSELARRKAAPLNGQEKKNLELWGYPYVFEQFRFHLTLTARIAEGKCKDRIHVVLLETFEPLLDDPLVIDALCLFVEPAPGEPLRCLHRFPFACHPLHPRNESPMTSSSPPKTFILDTNVILHDSTCIDHFQEHDIVLPITVLEELDQFKKGNQTLNYHAREFVRALDSLSAGKLLNGGVRIGPDKGTVSIKLEQVLHEDLRLHFPAVSKPDHQILNIGYHLAKEDPSRRYILVTKDVNLRMKAKAVGLMAEDYTTDHVKNIGGLYSGCRRLEDVDPELIETLHRDSQGVPVESLADHELLLANEYLILRNSRKSVLATHHQQQGRLVKINRSTVYGITPRNAEQSFAIHALCNPEVPLVTVSGKAGTGKTLLALAAALEQRSRYRQIMLARPIVPLSNKDIGYLPGDINSKIGPYMQPLYDNLAVIRGQFSEQSEMGQILGRLQEDKRLIIEPLAYIRGRSLVQMYMIVDEAQNLTPHEVKTIITRAGEGTKVVFTGDIHQIDHPYLDTLSNGLSHLIEKMQGQPLYAHVNLEKGERSELAMLASELL